MRQGESQSGEEEAEEVKQEESQSGEEEVEEVRQGRANQEKRRETSEKKNVDKISLQILIFLPFSVIIAYQKATLSVKYRTVVHIKCIQ